MNTEIIDKTYRKKSYFKNQIQQDFFKNLGFFFLFIFYVMPQYFGVSVAGFDLTAQRAVMLLVLLCLFFYKNRTKKLWSIVTDCKALKFIVVYLLVTLYTMVLRVDINSFAQPLIEFMCFFLLIYLISEEMTVEKTIGFIVMMLYLLCILGIVEAAMGKSVFHYLETLPGKLNTQVRSGSYRIMGPCNHALAYGLVLLVTYPIGCIEKNKKDIYVFNRPGLFLLVFINIFLTGSRSTLGLFLLELVVICAFSSLEKKKRTVIMAFLALVVFVALTVCLYKTSVGTYIMRQITSLIDTVFGTEYSIKYGADSDRLSGSTNYRNDLLQIFKLDYLNPLLGRGVSKNFSAEINGSFVRSVDNFFICQYIKYAYPGMFAYILFLIGYFIRLVRSYKEKRSSIILAVLIGALTYYINLWYMDALMTLKYVYLLFAIYEAFLLEPETSFEHSEKRVSKYIKGEMM